MTSSTSAMLAPIPAHLRPTLATILERTALERPILSERDLPTYREARATWATFRGENGRKAIAQPILTAPDGNAKLSKTAALATYGLSLAPARLGGVGNVCPASTRGCRAACLNTAGKGMLSDVQHGRVLRTRFLAAHPRHGLSLIWHETMRAIGKHGAIALRLNVLSDLRWERILPALMGYVWATGGAVYDYTKRTDRADAASIVPGYSLTYSASERDSDEHLRALLAAGTTVAVVVDVKRGRPLPATYLGAPVVDGDTTDARWLDAPGTAVLLRAKGAAIGTTPGFVRHLP